MKANELRIGNYVNEEYGGIYEVININSEGIDYVDLRKPTFKAIGRFDINSIKPIPLTEEWLVKLGYDLISENHYGILGHLIWKIEGRFYCDKNGMQLKYLHQLQNIFFALTNQELKINL